MKVFHAEGISEKQFEEILSVLNTGGVIGFPADTAYGLGADPFNEAALKRIFQIKGRTETKPILVLVDSLDMAESLIQSNEMLRAVANEFWPGPLTIVAPLNRPLPESLTAGSNSLGVRWPAAKFVMELIRRFGKPLTATSANRSGLDTPVRASDVQMQLGESLDILIDGGTLSAPEGSTVLDLGAAPPVVLREGPISFESLHRFFRGNIRRRIA